MLQKECGGSSCLSLKKPVSRPSWWKGKFAFFKMPATEGREGREHQSKANSSLLNKQWSRKFYKQKWGAATCRNSTVIPNSHLQTDHQWSGQHHLGGLGTVNLSSGFICSVSLWPVLGIAAALFLGTVWSSCS